MGWSERVLSDKMKGKEGYEFAGKFCEGHG